MARGTKLVDGVRRAIGYIRTDPNDEGVSDVSQRASIEVYCQEHNLVLETSWDDPNTDLDTPFKDRIGLAHALNDLAKKKATVLVVASLDRLSVSPVKGVIIEQLAKKRSGAVIESADGQAVDWGKTAPDLRSTIQQFQDTSEELDWAMQAEEDPSDADAIEIVKNLRVPRPNLAKKGKLEPMTFGAISDYLDKLGLVSRHGTPYSPDQVAKMADKKTPQEIERAEAEKLQRQRALADKEQKAKMDRAERLSFKAAG